MHVVRGVLTIRIVAVTSNFCLAIRSRMVSLTMLWLVETSPKARNERVLFTLTFHPNNCAVKNIILTNFKLLLNDSETVTIRFSQPTITSMTYKRDKNISNFFVRRALKYDHKLNPVLFSALTHVAKHVLSFSTLTGYRDLNDPFTSLIVFRLPPLMLFNASPSPFAGRRLGDRFREHLHDVEKDDKEPSKPVTRHFHNILLPQHSTSHKAICGPSLLNGGTESPKNLEQKLIFQIGILNPLGISERFSFNQFIFVYLFHSISFFISFYVNRFQPTA